MNICICGSMKKIKLIASIAHKLMQAEGFNVFIPSTYTTILDLKDEDLTVLELANLKINHRKLIDISDIIIIVDYGMGQDTYDEYVYAQKKEKTIVMLSEIIKDFHCDEILKLATE